MRRSGVLARDRSARADLRRALDDLESAERRAGLRPGPRRIWWVAVGIAVAAAVAVAGVGVAAWVRAATAYTNDDYRAAASAEIKLLLSPDAAGLQQVRRILDGATGSFYDAFAQSAESYTAFVRSSGTVTGASIDASALSRRDGDDAVVLVAATVTYRPGEPGGTPFRQFRLRVFVTPEDDRLKVGSVQYLP